jgi:hypothetical protein
MPTQPEPAQSAIDMLDLALGSADMVRRCLDELSEPDRALVSVDVLVGRAESCLDDVISTLRRLRIRIADLEGR